MNIKVTLWPGQKGTKNCKREKVKSRGAIWRPRQNLREMRHDDVIALGLESRVVPS